MKDVSSTSFGLIIAFLLPGLAGIYALKPWSPTVGQVFDTFLTSQSNVGLFFIAILAALVMGLLVTAIRWVIFERCICRNLRKEPPPFEELGFDGKLEAFRAAVDEHYRYHQFFGGMTIVTPLLFWGWLFKGRVMPTRLYIIGSFIVGVVVEFVFGWAAIDSFEKYAKRSHQIMEGKSGQRMEEK